MIEELLSIIQDGNMALLILLMILLIAAAHKAISLATKAMLAGTVSAAFPFIVKYSGIAPIEITLDVVATFVAAGVLIVVGLDLIATGCRASSAIGRLILLPLDFASWVGGILIRPFLGEGNSSARSEGRDDKWRRQQDREQQDRKHQGQ